MLLLFILTTHILIVYIIIYTLINRDYNRAREIIISRETNNVLRLLFELKENDPKALRISYMIQILVYFKFHQKMMRRNGSKINLLIEMAYNTNGNVPNYIFKNLVHDFNDLIK